MKQTTTTIDDIATDIRQLGVLIEHVIDQNDATLEAVSIMRDQVRHIPAIRAGLEEVKADVKTIKAAVIDTNKELHDVERRVTILEMRGQS
ncbi:MAG TPA: hypothetical protein VLF91_03810 [Candidatus Saccharimonadales bacterium]|nr:hypothetical protein [Candidatus Saccharimonadales bacterium]